MASASILLSGDHYLCSLCMDVFSDPVTTPCGHNYCKACITGRWDATDVCKCPLCQETFQDRPKVSTNTWVSEMVQQFRSNMWREEYEAKTVDEVQQMIQDRRAKIQEVKHTVELSKNDADREIADSVQVFTDLVRCIERSQAEVIDAIEEKQKTTEKQSACFINELQQEISQLEKRSFELKKISFTEDHLHLPQESRSINTEWIPSKDWTNVKVHQSSHVGTLRTAVAQLEKTLNEEMEKRLCGAELRRIQRYAVVVTLDPDTAQPWLTLSEDGKQVHHVSVKKNLPDNTERFSYGSCVLGKQSFSLGCFYYEIKVTRKTKWNVGVARESINRKGLIILCPVNGYWTIGLRNGNEYRACASPPVLLPVREKVQTVGVFVDYEEGLVSFYDVETRVHLCSFTGCSFTERLYPFFSPELNDGGKNSAPLIISPVTQKNTSIKRSYIDGAEEFKIHIET